MKQLKLWSEAELNRKIVACQRCGKDIVVQERTAAGIYSEYVDADGRCWDCATKKKRL